MAAPQPEKSDQAPKATSPAPAGAGAKACRTACGRQARPQRRKLRFAAVFLHCPVADAARRRGLRRADAARHGPASRRCGGLCRQGADRGERPVRRPHRRRDENRDAARRTAHTRKGPAGRAGARSAPPDASREPEPTAEAPAPEAPAKPAQEAAEAKPVEAKPVEVKPEETKPVEAARPETAKPVEAPVEAKPVEVAPPVVATPAPRLSPRQRAATPTASPTAT